MIKGLYPFGLNHYRSLKFQKLRKLISKNQKKIKVEGAYGSSLSFLLIDIFSSINQQIFYISNSKETASYVYSDIIELIGEKNCSFLPSNYRYKIVNKDEDADIDAQMKSDVLQFLNSKVVQIEKQIELAPANTPEEKENKEFALKLFNFVQAKLEQKDNGDNTITVPKSFKKD